MELIFLIDKLSFNKINNVKSNYILKRYILYLDVIIIF